MSWSHPYFNQELLGWAIILAIGLPIAVLVLGELSERLQRQGNPLAHGVRQIRHVVLPVLAVLLVMQHILGIEDTESSYRMVETLFWMTVVYVAFILVRQLVQLDAETPTSWTANVPPLFFALGRGVVIFWVATHVLSGIWGVDLSKMGTAAGVLTMAIEFALQDTIGNLVSGFLLLADRPFKEGDWCLMNGEWLVVKHIGWRTTRFEDAGNGGDRIIPNGSLSKQSITNIYQEGGMWKQYFKIGFFL